MSVHNKLYINDSLYTGKVDNHVFTTDGWGHLSTVDQDLSKNDSPLFSSLKFGGGDINNVHLKYEGDEGYDLKFPDAPPVDGKSLKMGVTGLSWVSNAGFNQSLNTSDSVIFNSLTASNGLEVNSGSINVVVGDLTLGSGSVTLTSGALNVASGSTSLRTTTATSLTVSGATGLAATTATSLTVSGATELAATTASSLTVSGATELAALNATNLDLSGTLGVSGLSTLATVSAGDVTASGLTVSTSGLTVSAGGLTVSAGGITVDAGGLTVSAGDFTIASGVVSKLKNTEIVGTLSTSGVSTLHGLVVQTGTFDVNVGLSTVQELKAQGAATLDSTLSVAGASTLTGLVTASNGVTLSSGNLAVSSGNATVSGNTTLTGNASVGGTLGVTGLSTLGQLNSGASTLASLTVSGNTTINGSLFVNGTTTTIDTTDMEIKDRVIVLNKGGAAPITGGVAGNAPVGIEVDRGTQPNSGLLYQEALVPYWKVGTSSTYHRLLEALDGISEDDNGKIPVFDTTGRLSASIGISKHAADQLKNMDSGSFISTGQWEYLSNLDQDLATTSNVSFDSLTVSNLTVGSGFSLEAGSSLAQSVSTEIVTSGDIFHGITIVSTVTGTTTLYLPNNEGAKGKTFAVYFKSKTSSHIVDVVPNGTDEIEGSASFSLVQPGQHVRFTSLGYGNWIVN